jgi:protein phosphatase
MNKPELVLDWCQAYAVTDIGKKRSQNEDSYFLGKWSDNSAILAVVADGMGGNAAGQIASQIAVDTFKLLLDNPLPNTPIEQHELLLKQCYLADEKVRERAYQSFQTLGMGTTVVVAIITPQTCMYINVGDSRLYQFRGNNIQYKSTDHSIVQLLLECGKIKPEDIPTHPMRNVLSSCLGGKNAEGNFSIYPKWNDEKPPIITGENSDIFLLCSDGLHSLVSDKQLLEIYQNNPSELASKSLELALENGGLDNITILTIQLRRHSEI